jgi:hypothetical protein
MSRSVWQSGSRCLKRAERFKKACAVYPLSTTFTVQLWPTPHRSRALAFQTRSAGEQMARGGRQPPMSAVCRDVANKYCGLTAAEFI